MMTVWGALVALIIALYMDSFPIQVATEGWLAIIGLAVGSSGLATIVYLSVIDRNGPTELAKINYFPPFVAVLLGVVWLGEPFTPRIAIAFAIIMFGVWFAKSRPNPSNP